MGILKTQSTLTIAVWSSILLHIAGFLGFELAFSNKRESFPKSEPRTVTIVSISTLSNSVSSVEMEVENNIQNQLLENISSKAPVYLEKKLPVETLKDTYLSELVSDNNITNNLKERITPTNNSMISAGTEVGEKTALVTEPIPLGSIEPEYPFRARKKGLEGIVIMNVIISKYGEPVSCYITDSSGHKDLDNAALDTVMSSYFQPGTVNGEEMESLLVISISFKLNKS